MVPNKISAIIVCSILLLSSVQFIAPVKAESTQINNLVSFTLYGWVWSPNYAAYGIGNITLTVTNGNITYSSDSPDNWNLYFQNSQLNITIQPGVIQTYAINLTGAKTGTFVQVGEVDYPTRSDFSGVWLDNNYIWVRGHINLALVEGDTSSSISTYYFIMRTRNVDIPVSTSSDGFSANVESIINNVFRIIEEINKQMYQLRSALSNVLYGMMAIYNQVLGKLS